MASLSRVPKHLITVIQVIRARLLRESISNTTDDDFGRNRTDTGRTTPVVPGLTLGGPQIYHFIFLRPTPKTQSTHERAVELVSGTDFGATCPIFRAGARPRTPGARRGPQGAEHRPKTRGQIYHFIIHKSAQPGGPPV